MVLDLNAVSVDPVRHDLDDLFEITNGFSGRADIESYLSQLNFGFIDEIYQLLLDELNSLNYSITSLNNNTDMTNSKQFMFRYDVHVHDIIAAYKLALIHERLQIPGVFYLT